MTGLCGWPHGRSGPAPQSQVLSRRSCSGMQWLGSASYSKPQDVWFEIVTAPQPPAVHGLPAAQNDIRVLTAYDSLPQARTTRANLQVALLTAQEQAPAEPCAQHLQDGFHERRLALLHALPGGAGVLQVAALDEADQPVQRLSPVVLPSTVPVT